MKLKKEIKIMPLLFLAGLAFIIMPSCKDQWNEHYKDPGKEAPHKNLWENISAMPELEKFAGILEQTGYDEILSKSQMFTVWAPDNEALEAFNIADSALVKEFIENHVAIYATSASGVMDHPVTMLNGKVVKFHSENGDNYFFGNATAEKSNILSVNGILHIIDSYVPFQDNIWEYLAKDGRITDIRDYLYSFNDIVFNPNLSTPGGGYDDEGNAIYLDSVFTNMNVMFSTIGRINVEDSTYTMLVPDNKAWHAKYEEARKYFNFYHVSSAFADSLQEVTAKQAVVTDLVFSDKMQLAPSDSLVSTNYAVFRNPADLILGATEVSLSNGRVFITDTLRFNPSETWHSSRTVEAETVLGRLNEGSSIYSRSSLGTEFEDISGNTYIETVPSGVQTNPTVTFEVPITLSATYNIYCVFVPETILKSENEARPFKVAFQLLYLNGDGTNYQSGIIRPDNAVTGTEGLTRMLVAENYTFPVVGGLWNDNLGGFENTTKIKVISDVRGSAEQQMYSRNLLIDCIIFEPVD